MDNPAYFTVLNNDGAQARVSGLLSSKAAAMAEAESRREEGEAGRFDIAIVTIFDQDPASGTPFSHAAPHHPAGYALGSLSAADPARRSLEGILFDKEWIARTIAGAARAKNLASRNDTVLDVVAITVLNPED
jgi:hypothetical protein